MKRTSLFLRLGTALLFCLSAFVTVSPASGAAGNRCKDRCNDSYHRRKDECRGLRRYEKRRCEDRAKYERDECKRRCR
ncbi:MAG TPA: hypothetical protein VHD88_03090 [Pyrinomonadaceae bacterium]|nr:hypothetical protein [Pyrinomonadaceae bacterium]